MKRDAPEDIPLLLIVRNYRVSISTRAAGHWGLWQ